MRTSNRPALLLSLALATASATASATTMVLGGGYETPRDILVLDDGLETGSAGSALGGGFVTPAAGFDARIDAVREGLRVAAVEAQCAPASLELRLKRRLRRTNGVLASVLRSPSGTEAASRLTRAVELHRGYCETVRSSTDLAPECASRLLIPCPRNVPQQ
jgi:hypothetical protein